MRKSSIRKLPINRGQPFFSCEKDKFRPAYNQLSRPTFSLLHMRTFHLLFIRAYRQSKALEVCWTDKISLYS